MASSNDPGAWPVREVVEWLHSCKLEQFATAFADNEVDGKVLMSDGLDDSMVKELIPNFKCRVLFNSEKKKLHEMARGQIKNPNCNDSPLETSSRQLEPLSQPVDPSFTRSSPQLPIIPTRSSSRTQCKWHEAQRNKIQLDVSQLIQPFNTIHTLPIPPDMFSFEDRDILSKSFNYMCSSPNENDTPYLDSCFDALIEEPLDASNLIKTLDQFRCLKPYVVDSLKRFHSLSDTIHTLSQCFDLPAAQSTPFIDIVDQITKHTLLVCTIESLSFDSQRFFSNLIQKNDLPIPLAYFTPKEFKINFNSLVEPLCFTPDRSMLLMGSSSTMGLGKTSLIPYIFDQKRNESLNTDGNRALRSSCVDVIFAKLENNSSYIVYDVHGTMDVLNEDLITAIQHYCAVQIICVTETDLNQNEFLPSVMNYSVDTRAKPTVVVIFDSNYNGRGYDSTKIMQDFQTRYEHEQWQHVSYMTAPILKSLSNSSGFNTARQMQRLRQSFLNCLQHLKQYIDKQYQAESIFSVEAYFLTIKSATNVCPSPTHTMTTVAELDKLFQHLNDTTKNLRAVTPITYLDAEILKCEKKLSSEWQESSTNIEARLEELRQELHKIDRIPAYAQYFITLITKRPYIELLITEKYLEKWRAQFEPLLIDRMTAAKNDAMIDLSGIKLFEEQIQHDIDKQTDAERQNNINQLQILHHDYKSRQKLINNIEVQLANIDLTIGLFCDEILAVYEHYPQTFNSENLLPLLARKLVELMHKGFSFHILRGRPLRCHSKLMQECLRYLQQSTNTTPVVLTVIGEQSSAKSSLLNATFGCNFRVSAGRCTIGMYLSIVRWQNLSIVIFDTEGLLSLEESGSIFDNQMVSMAMLSSHVVLINHKGEFSSNLEHLIGMSFYAKLQIRSPLKPKLLFVLRDQSDTAATGIFFRQLSKFKENLYNDSKFLKSSIDEELEIDDQNVILLPNAFSSDTNSILGVEQTWRNRTFPMKILELRKMIFKSLRDANLQVYTDLSHLYQKIACNWDAIDRLGPNLLACKTLYELSVMNELRDIANDIAMDCVNNVGEEGRQHIDRVLASITSSNLQDTDMMQLHDRFNTCLQNTHQRITEQGKAEFHSKTERSCFPLELKYKIEKMIEPPITYTQVMLRDQFTERLHKSRRDARISSAQQRLIDNVQSDFDQNANLSLEDLKTRINSAYVTELEVCNRTLRPEFDDPEQTTMKILQIYNAILLTKTANTRRGSIYNLLYQFEVHSFQKQCQRFDGAWECMVTREPQETTTSSRLVRAVRRVFLGNPPDEYAEELWRHLHEHVLRWFYDPYSEYKNKKILLSVFVELLPQLRADISKLVCERFQSSSDTRVIPHTFELVENLMNADTVKRNVKHLSQCNFISDVMVIAVKTVIDETIAIEQQRQRMELEKAQKYLLDWKSTIEKQFQFMQDSFDQGRNMAAIVIEQIFEEMCQLILEKTSHDIMADIVKSQFINHDAIQKQAYEESIVQANGEKILKYVLDINRFFVELGLREIRTSLVSIIHMHVLSAEQKICDVINKSNSTVQASKDENARLIADAIERDIRKTDMFVSSREKKFCLATIMSLPIKNIDNFKRGFKTILLNTGHIPERMTILTQKVKVDALNGCKTRLARRLGCQSCCPGCGAKCSRPEPHEEELFQPWHDCNCRPGRCKCIKSQPVYVTTHESSYHLAQAFHGGRYYKLHTPALALCYQGWKTAAMVLADDEEVFPLQKYYHIHHQDWYNNLDVQSRRGTASDKDRPPAEQCRAWMVVRPVLLQHYSRFGMIDNEDYDSKVYPRVKALRADYEPKWNDVDLN